MIMRYHEYDYDYTNQLITYAACFLSNCSFFWRGGGVAIPPRDLNPANDHILPFAK